METKNNNEALHSQMDPCLILLNVAVDESGWTVPTVI